MTLVITHNGTDITNNVSTDGVSIADERDSTRDTLNFTIEKTPGGFAPELGAEIIVTLDSTRIFGGSVLSFETSVEAPPTVTYAVDCVDFTHQLDRKLVTERYLNQTANAIIADLVSTYAPGFTIVGVDAQETIARVSFNRITLSECLNKLAKLNNYVWYVDYNKDVHFFAKSGEVAPFNLTDTSGNYITESLRIRSDLSQLRNVIEVIGGKVPIAARSTLHAGDGETTEFATNFEFSNKPTVTLDGVTQTVGTEYLNVEGFDCYWSFQQKYVRFDDTNVPPAPSSGTTNINLNGTPLVPLVAVVPDAESIEDFGEFEYSIREETLGSQEQTVSRALAEIEAYAAQLNEAQFETYTPGLRSGQLITINSTLHNVNADYIVQSVQFRPYPNGSELAGVWSAKLASTATMTIVDALRKLLGGERLEDDERQVLLAFYRFTDRATAGDSVDTPETTTRPYYLADGAGVVGNGKTPFICNYAVLEA
jgi:hypothetical protein